MIAVDLAFRGTVVVAALLIDPALLGEQEARRRVLGVFRPGATVRETPHGYLVSLTERIVARESPGAPLVRLSGYLTNVPLSVEQARALGAPPGSLLLAIGGEIVVVDLGAAALVDPSVWLDCTGYTVAAVETPRVRFAKLQRERIAPPPDPLSAVVRRDESAGWKAARLAMEQAQRQAPKASAHGGHAGPSAAETGLVFVGIASFLGLLSGLLSILGLAVGALIAAASAPSSRSADESLAPRDDPAPGLLARWAQTLERLASKMLLSTRLGALIGRKHAQYFEEMLDAFARKDFDEALKRAIPLGGEAGADGFESIFGNLVKRGALTITPRLGASTGGFGVGPVGYQSLRELYRAAFEALDERGDVDRASFVLAELLRENAEAVAYLERHGRFRLAAELAEHRRLESGLVVRLWFLANDPVHAVHLARRDGAFAAAILAAERAEKEQGGEAGLAKISRALRATWMDTLAEAGDFEGAATVALADHALRPFAVSFWKRARSAPGTLAGRSLAQALLAGESEDPASGEDIATVAERLIVGVRGAADDLAAEESAGFVQLLAHAESRSAPRAARKVARLAARSILASRPGEVPRATIEGLVAVGADALLQADLPPRLVSVTALPLRAELAGVGLPGASFSDVALLPGGRLLAAAGAHGVFWLDRHGRTLARFDAPASALVVSDAGTRALALLPTGDETFRITRIDLVGRRAEPWTETKLEAFCRTFDGDTWLVANRRDLVLLDCLGPRPAPLGKLPLAREADADGARSLWRARGTTRAYAVQRHFDERERRPGLRRTQVEGFTLRGVRDCEVGSRLGAAIGGRVEWLVTEPGHGTSLSRLPDAGHLHDARALLLPDGFVGTWLRAEPLLTLVGGRAGDDAVLLVVGDNLRIWLELRAPGAQSIVVSDVVDGQIAVADDRGRSGVFALPMLA